MLSERGQFYSQYVIVVPIIQLEYIPAGLYTLLTWEGCMGQVPGKKYIIFNYIELLAGSLATL